MSGPRVRFCPSPTGFFHVGSARTALFNWLFARQRDGVFLLRIEDTDQTRDREEYVEVIYEAMGWLGLSPDVPATRQSANFAAHSVAAAALLEHGFLYYCDCTPAEIEARKAPGSPPGYDGYCRDRGLERSATTALRFRTPREGVTVVHDLIRGDVEFVNSLIDDFVVVRSSGGVLYALANATDDRNDRITHVIRGEEHLANAPKQILLWESLNASSGNDVAVPLYAHLPLLVNEQRKKLSKRRDPVSTELYRNEGYLSSAFVNYLALLGWSPRGDDEIVPLSTLVEQFRLEDVSHSPAFFDVKKLRHMNGEYVRALSPEEFLVASAPWVDPWHAAWQPSDREPSWRKEQFSPGLFASVAPLVQERVAVLSEIPGMVEFFFLDEPRYDEAAFAKVITNDPVGTAILEGAIARYEVLDDWSAPALHDVVERLGNEHGLALRKAQAPIRCAVTGSLIGPPLFESLHYLGRARTLARLRHALTRSA
ncbi:MAG TPA: glutamate--tRNA ligase [Acidimicrobiales bacterium]|nr:glutamate--tRNA ligase [Acidimicrobiales bacterium]